MDVAPAAVDDDFASGCVAAFVGGEMHDDAGHLVGLTDAT
jgi:hypothetical protein